MKPVKQWMALISMTITAVAIIAGCNRPIVVPVQPGIANTRTSTSTATVPVGATATATTTQVTISVSAAGVVPNSNQSQGATGVPVLRLSASNPSGTTSTLTSLTLNASGTGSDNTGITAVRLYLDANNNGVVDGGETQLAFSTYSANDGTVTLNFSNPIAGSSTANYLVVYDFSASAAPGTYQATLSSNTSVVGTDNTSQPLIFSGAPVAGATLTILGNTSTPTGTSTRTLTRTATSTATFTRTLTRTASPTSTSTGAFTSTSTLTRTGTPTTTRTSTRTQTPTSTNTSTGPTNTATSSSTATETPSAPTACTILENGIESMTENGTFSSGGAFATVSQSSLHATQGTYSLDLNLTTGGSNNAMNWGGFDPGRLTNVASIVIDIYADASVIDAGWNQILLVAQSSSAGNYWSPLTTYTDIQAGQHSVTFAVDFGQGTLSPSALISNFVFVWNTSGSAANTGHIYFDNIRFVGTSPTACPPSTCGLMNSYETTTENGAFSSGGAFATVSQSTSGATLGTYSVDLNFTTGGSNNAMNWGNFVPGKLTDATEIVMDITIDPSLIDAGWNQILLVAQSSSAGNYWSPLTTYIDVSAGTNTVTFPIDFGQGTLSPSALISNLVFVWNTSGTVANTGHIYFDNIRVRNSPSCSTGPVIDTPTPTDTVSGPADTATETPTETETPLVPDDTPTQTATPTSTTCVPTLQASYTFDSSTECWTAWAGNADGPTTSTLEVDSSSPHGGAGALMVVIPYGAAGGQEMIGIDFGGSPVSVPAGSVLSFWYKSSVAGGDGQAFNQSGGYQWNSGGWQSPLSTSWTQVTVTMNPVVPSSVEQIGFQVPGSDDAFTSPVTIWIDDVTITAPPAPPCTLLENSVETMTENGTFSSGGAFATVSQSASNATLGTYSLDLNLTTGGSNNVMNWGAFDPGRLTNVGAIIMDIYADASVIDAGWNQILLVAQSSSAGNYWSPLTAYTDIQAGQHSVTFAVDFGQGTLSPSALISNLVFVWNTSGGAGKTGHIYFDNIRFAGTSPTACPPSTCGLMNSYETTTENGAFSSGGAFATVSQSTSGATLGTYSVDLNFTTGGSNNAMNWGNFVPGKLTDATEIVMDITADASLIDAGWNQILLVAQSSSAGNYWSPLTTYIDISAGTNTVTFPIDFGQGTLSPSALISNLVFVWNTSGTVANTGHIYFDNIRVRNSPSCTP